MTSAQLLLAVRSAEYCSDPAWSIPTVRTLKPISVRCRHVASYCFSIAGSPFERIAEAILIQSTDLDRNAPVPAPATACHGSKEQATSRLVAVSTNHLLVITEQNPSRFGGKPLKENNPSRPASCSQVPETFQFLGAKVRIPEAILSQSTRIATGCTGSCTCHSMPRFEGAGNIKTCRHEHPSLTYQLSLCRKTSLGKTSVQTSMLQPSSGKMGDRLKAIATLELISVESEVTSSLPSPQRLFLHRRLAVLCQHRLRLDARRPKHMNYALLEGPDDASRRTRTCRRWAT